MKLTTRYGATISSDDAIRSYEAVRQYLERNLDHIARIHLIEILMSQLVIDTVASESFGIVEPLETQKTIETKFGNIYADLIKVYMKDELDRQAISDYCKQNNIYENEFYMQLLKQVVQQLEGFDNFTTFDFILLQCGAEATSKCFEISFYLTDWFSWASI